MSIHNILSALPLSELCSIWSKQVSCELHVDACPSLRHNNVLCFFSSKWWVSVTATWCERFLSCTSDCDTKLLGTVLEGCPAWLEPNWMQSVFILFNEFMSVFKDSQFHKLKWFICRNADFRLKMYCFLYLTPQMKGVNLSCVRTCMVVAEERPRITLTQSFSKLFKDLGLSARAVSTTFGCRVNVAICLQVRLNCLFLTLTHSISGNFKGSHIQLCVIFF